MSHNFLFISVFGLGAPKSNEIVLSRLRVQSLGDIDVYVIENIYRDIDPFSSSST